MTEEIDPQKIHGLGLARVEAYVPFTQLLSSFSTAANNSQAPDQSSCSRMTDAERTGKRRKKLASSGLAQCNIITPDSSEARGHLTLLAKRLVQESGSWENAILSDPVVAPLLRELNTLQLRAMRIDDLEERHRKTRMFVDFHNDLMTSTGVRRIGLFLLGIVKTPFSERCRFNSEADK